MRISDWSSDVCSSDLIPEDAARGRIPVEGVAVGAVIGGEPWVHCGNHRCLEASVVLEPDRDGVGVAHDGGIDERRERMAQRVEFGRASCRERVGTYV